MSTEFKLIDVVKAGDQAECTRLLELEDIDIYIHERDEDDRSSIFWASRQGHVNIVELLLSKGADINDKDDYGLSSILAASVGGHVNVVELLLSRGAVINDKDNDGWSSIIAASFRGHVNVVELLLSKGANLHDIANDGFTAISLFNNDKIKYILRKWPISMAILILKDLSLYCAGIDNDFLIDLYQYMGREDCTTDNEENYNLDE